jgi:hypothetical protein
MPSKYRWLLLGLSLAVVADGQTAGSQSSPPNTNTPGTNTQSMDMGTMNEAGMSLMNLASGTSVNPASWNPPMVLTRVGSWSAMLMGTAFVVDTQQSGPRGGDKLFSANWFMISAQHNLGSKSAFQIEAMLSLEPATITNRRYPLLFQTGETAYGTAIVDGQHPHDFIMSLGFHYIRQLDANTTLDAYFAPVGDPALGPVAFPHRASASELPEAPLSHHWQDSTHIASEVVTIGITRQKIRLEASGFYGSEPGENRWTIDSGPINSWSGRLWYFPSDRWAAQVSTGRIAKPEALEPGDQIRSTASIEYGRPVAGGTWASSLIWGRNHSTATHRDLNSYLIESVLPIRTRNFLTGRIELVHKDELFADQPALQLQMDRLYGSTFRIGGYTIGYTRDVELFRSIETGVGVNFTAYSLPDAIKPFYGRHPVGGNIFIRFKLRSRT